MDSAFLGFQKALWRDQLHSSGINRIRFILIRLGQITGLPIFAKYGRAAWAQSVNSYRFNQIVSERSHICTAHAALVVPPCLRY